MASTKNTVEKFMDWHHLRRKIFTKQLLSDRDFELLRAVITKCEGRLFPTIAEIASYRRLFVQLEETDPRKEPKVFQMYLDKIAAFEEKYLSKHTQL